MAGTVALSTLVDLEALKELMICRELKIVYNRGDVTVYEGINQETGETDFQFYVVPNDVMWAYQESELVSVVEQEGNGNSDEP